MTRYILVDAHSGYVFGDTADRWWKMDADAPVNPMDAAMSLDIALMMDNSGWSYENVSRHDSRVTYHVFKTDNEFPIIFDGQDQKSIDAVIRDCSHVASISRYMDA